MDSPDPGVRLALLDTLRAEFSADELAVLHALAVSDPQLFIAEVISFHETKRITLNDDDLRTLRRLFGRDDETVVFVGG